MWFMASFNSCILLEVSPLALKRLINIFFFFLNQTVMTLRGILEKELPTGSKEICSGKCHEKGWCQHSGDTRISRINLDVKYFQEGSDIPKTVMKTFLQERKGMIP